MQASQYKIATKTEEKKRSAIKRRGNMAFGKIISR
jgi:hypothetical protein